MEYGFQHAVVGVPSLVPLKLVGDIGYALLESSITGHLARRFERKRPDLREQARLQGLDLGLRSEARARQVLAKDQSVLGLLEGPACLEPCHAELRTYEFKTL